VTPIRLERNISKGTWARDFKFGTQQCPAGAQIIFPESGRGLGHVTLQFWQYTVGYPADSLASCCYGLRPGPGAPDPTVELTALPRRLTGLRGEERGR